MGQIEIPNKDVDDFIILRRSVLASRHAVGPCCFSGLDKVDTVQGKQYVRVGNLMSAS